MKTIMKLSTAAMVSGVLLSLAVHGQQGKAEKPALLNTPVGASILFAGKDAGAPSEHAPCEHVLPEKRNPQAA